MEKLWQMGRRVLRMVKRNGMVKSLWMFTSVVEDRYLNCFDRLYHVRTSGNIPLGETSFDRAKLENATAYGPVNAWGFRKLLCQLQLPKHHRFVDLGCGLGRACLLAGEYGFAQVTGVELAGDLCAVAEQNVATWRARGRLTSSVRILQADVSDYCEASADDIFFMFRPFSWDYLQVVARKLQQNSTRNQKPLTVIYCDRLAARDSFARAFTAELGYVPTYQMEKFGYVFYVYRCSGETD